MNEATKLQFLWLAMVAIMLGGCMNKDSGEPDASGSPGSPTTGNSAPTIWGSPAGAVMTGESYAFTPSTDDADGDALSFEISNSPDWASFDIATGTLSGQPDASDLGVYSQIEIRVTDGNAWASLAPFSIEVTETALGSLTVSWTAPTQNTDATTLTDLAGFYLYYGESRGSHPIRIKIDNPSISTYVIDNLLPRTYFIVATAFNSVGIESELSNEKEMTVTSP